MNQNDEYDLILKHCKFNICNSFNNFSNDFKKNYFSNFISDAAYFDLDYYYNNYLKKLDEKVDPIIHYLTVGSKKGFNPNSDFDGDFYLNEYEDVKRMGMNPFIHFLKYGLFEGRLPKILTLSELFNQNLNLTLKGKKKFLFLVNDSNNELKQHFDFNYKNLFDSNNFVEIFNRKKALCESLNIKFYSFIIPDKSIVCKDFLPFKVNSIKRNIDQINCVYDFKEYLSHEHYFKYDSHINFRGGKILSLKILNTIDKNFTSKNFIKLLDKSEDIIVHRSYDLFFNNNWSYSDEELEYNKINSKVSDDYRIPQPINLENIDYQIPENFKYSAKRESHLYKNKNSYSNLKVLIFHDSCIEFLKPFLSFYFSEMFLFWDHGSFNKELIEYYKPDIVLEILVERFLENLPKPLWI